MVAKDHFPQQTLLRPAPRDGKLLRMTLMGGDCNRDIRHGRKCRYVVASAGDLQDKAVYGIRPKIVGQN